MINRKVFVFYLILFFASLSLISQISNADPLDHWHFRESFTDREICSVTYGNGIFVAVSHEIAEIYTSTDGAIWTETGFTTFGGVTYGNGIFVAVGDNRKIYTSLDGIDWQKRYSLSGSWLNAVGYGNGIFVAVGWDSLITSLDGGMTWNRTAITSDFYGVAYGNGLFVAVGKWGNVLTSPDGINWTLGSVSSSWNIIHLYGVAYGNGTFVAVGSDSSTFTRGRIVTSQDGIHWKIKSFNDNFEFHGVTYNNETFVAVGTGSTIYTSSDGVDWKKRNSNSIGDLQSIAYGNYTFVAVGYPGVILQSDPTGPEVISTPNLLSGPTGGLENVSYSFSTGGSYSYLDHPVQYLFDWGDGTNSGWLSVGTTSANKSWDSLGTYEVRAQARCANHTSIFSSWSEALSVTISSPPSPPTNVHASDGEYLDKVEVTWEASSTATSYSVYRATSSSTWASKANLGSTSDTLFNDTSAVPKTTYYYYVKASNASGISGFSSYDTGYRSDGTPSVPINIQATDGTYVDKVELTWTASSGATSYTVYRATSLSRRVSKTTLGTTSETYFNDTTAVPMKTYYYYVKASNVYGTSDFSSYDAGYRSDGSPPIPTNVAASDGVYIDKVEVTWTGSPEATSYTVYRATSNTRWATKVPVGTTSNTTYDDITAAVGKTYYYWVKASNSYGASGYSAYDTGYR